MMLVLSAFANHSGGDSGCHVPPVAIVAAQGLVLSGAAHAPTTPVARGFSFYAALFSFSSDLNIFRLTSQVYT